MRRTVTGSSGDTTRCEQSDQDLLMGLARGELTALGGLYDRYGALVFRLAGTVEYRDAEALTADVFLDLWALGYASRVRESVLTTLLHLTAVAAAKPQADGHVCHPSVGQRSLSGLAPFLHLPGAVFDVLVMTCLGSLTVEEIATALARERTAVRQALALGFANLRGAGRETPAEQVLNGVLP